MYLLSQHHLSNLSKILSHSSAFKTVNDYLLLEGQVLYMIEKVLPDPMATLLLLPPFPPLCM